MKFGFFNDWRLGVVRGGAIVDVSDALVGADARSPMDLARAVYYLAVNEEMRAALVYTSLGDDGPVYDLVLPNQYERLSGVEAF